MRSFERFGLHSVWSRLLGTLAVVAVPTTLLISFLAYSLFHAALTSLEASQLAAAGAATGAMQSWFDAAGRSLINEAFAAGYVDGRRCEFLARSFLKRNPGFLAARFYDETSTPCTAGTELDAADVPPPAAVDDSAFGVFAFRNRLWIVAHESEGGREWTCLLAVEESALRERLSGSRSDGENYAVLLGADKKVFSSNASLVTASWLPADFTTATPGAVWRAADHSGASASFVLTPIAGAPLSLLMRFDNRELQNIRRRLVVLCLSLVGLLGALAYVYAATIRRDIVFWIQGIELAARSRGRDPESVARAPVTSLMPMELRSVAESFNAMADRAVERRHDLMTSLAENRALMLEMHHRIKNSLQVIQSYLALIRRSAGRPEAQILARIEARVGVLAIAYRLALTPGGMRPMAVRPFLEEICAAAVGGLRRPRQRVAYALTFDGELVVDRAIPLGLGLVEAMIAAFSAADTSYVGVTLSADDGEVELRVVSDANPAEIGLPDKVMRGLANQLGASGAPSGGGEILIWRFHP